ncbi:MAG TPA: Trm112 family protein, partial [Candidatus Deferrimicrobium sp.]|nr:Trm112 family protein [Candidatus Deferrimicrobium sp.]
MKRKLMEILACPIDKYHPLDLLVFEEKDEIVEGLIVCPKCQRWYPIRDEIPEMLPDELRKEADDLCVARRRTTPGVRMITTFDELMN